MERLNAILPAAWSHGNPIDVIGDADPEKYVKAVEIVARDPGCDGLLVILTPQAMTNATATAERMQAVAKICDKPILASWMGGYAVDRGIEILNRAGIPTFPYPDTAAQVFQYMWQYSDNLTRLYQTPEVTSAEEVSADARARVEATIQAARKDNRTLFTEDESKQLLASYGIPTVPTHVAATEAEAVQKANEVGYPTVLKLYSHTITHKTDVGGVQLNLQNADDVKRAFQAIQKSVAEKAGAKHFNGVTVQPMIRLKGQELILGSSVDAQFGPVLLFGLGGQLVEVFKDRALALPPLTTVLARQCMERTKIFSALKGVRGQKSVDLAALDRILVRFSQLIVEQRRIKEIDINPLLVSPDGIIALDARVLLHDWKIPDEQLPRAAIRPYPTRYVGPWTLKDGTAVTIRPIRPEDELLMIKFHETLSEQTVRLRYQDVLKLDQRIAHQRLTRVCFADYNREMALVAEQQDPKTGQRQILAVGRLSKVHSRNEGRLFLLVSDQFQGKGLGRELSKRLIQVARDEKLARVFADMLPETHAMLHLCQSFGFKIAPASGHEPLRAELVL
jgi:acetyltransferase